MDCVSSLPDELLCHVLSFLKTKDAALTSVLSKRWRDLIAFVPYLDIDDSVFLHPEDGKRDRPEIIRSFVDFVDRILALQGNYPVMKFYIKCYCLTMVDSHRVDGWISNVLARGVSDLDLAIILDVEEDEEFIKNRNYQVFPKCFESSTLVKLKINCGIDIGWEAGSVFLPMLKTLVLDSPQVTRFDIFLHALPALEELVLVDVFWQDWDVNISSASLKTLTLYRGDCHGSLSFDTPSLVYFEYTGFVQRDYPVVNMKNLLDAQINFSLSEEGLRRVREPDDHDWYDTDAILGNSNVWKLFHGLRNVQNLDLSPDTLEVLSRCCESMPVFKNLKTLSFYSGVSRWQAVPVLLKSCPHLETLSILGLLHVVTDTCRDVCDCIPREDKGRSVTSCPVKKIEIQGFIGAMREITMISHFLDYFPCLKEIEISLERHGPTKLDVPEVPDLKVQMMKLHKKSLSCNVEITVWESL